MNEWRQYEIANYCFGLKVPISGSSSCCATAIIFPSLLFNRLLLTYFSSPCSYIYIYIFFLRNWSVINTRSIYVKRKFLICWFLSDLYQQKATVESEWVSEWEKERPVWWWRWRRLGKRGKKCKLTGPGWNEN